MNKKLTKSAERTIVSPLAKIDQQYRAVFDAVTDGILISNPLTGQFIEVNQSACQMLGCEKADIIGRDIEMFSSGIHPYTQEMAIEKSKKAYSGEVQTFDWQCKTKNGVVFWAEVTLRYTEFGPTPTIVANVRDITERREQNERFRQLAENITETFWMSNLEMTETLYVSPGYEAIWGRSCQSLYENPDNWFEAIHEDDRERIAEIVSRQALDDNLEYRIVRPDGEVRWIADRAFPICDDNGKIYRLGGIARDITEHKRLRAEIEYMAHYDPLTGLANRFVFKTALDRAVAQSRRTGHRCALLLLDLDHFKDVNDTRGHPFGDRLLRLAAERLQAAARMNEGAFRLGGDEFAILLNDPYEKSEIAALADRLIAAISSPFTIDDVVVEIGISVGIAIHGPNSRDADTLMSHADSALYRAKGEERQNYRFYCDATDRTDASISTPAAKLARSLLLASTTPTRT